MVQKGTDMKIEEAIKQLELNRPPAYTELREAIDIAMNALEYQIPKNPLPKGTHKGFDNFCCPSCKKPLSSRQEEFEVPCCENCGQALNWSEVEEC